VKSSGCAPVRNIFETKEQVNEAKEKGIDEKERKRKDRGKR
jgi:hypothetical protein